MNRREFSTALALAVTGAAVTPTLWVAIGAAQEATIRILGRVEWIAAQVMVIGLDGMLLAAGAPAAVTVDLSHVDQDEYHGLVTGDPVVVTGTVPSARDRVIATSVQRLAS